MSNIILGAGLAGMIAACHFKDAQIFEAGPELSGHKALLRFRDQSVSTLTGIPFKEVHVRKAISIGETLYDTCNIKLANMYSRKVSGTITGRSIWNLAPVTRYVAPDDFHAQLVDRHRDRVAFNTPITTILPISHGTGEGREKYISTIPLSVMAKVAKGFSLQAEVTTKTEKAAIRVDRFKIPCCDVYQTIYFPEGDLRVFRASITGDILIVESLHEDHMLEDPKFSGIEFEATRIIPRAFGIEGVTLDFQETVDQKYGKIVSLPDDIRHAALYELTRDFGIYSLGRFATWRNILLDDVVKDIHVIDELMSASDYGRHKFASKKAPK